MHLAAYDFIAAHDLGHLGTVVECGARDINGSIRDLFDCDHYIAVDVRPGEGVDVVCDFADYQPNHLVDAVVSTEVFEHTPNWPDLIRRAAAILRPGGVFLATMATDPRAPHSAVSGGGLEPDEFYANVLPATLDAILSECFPEHTIDVAGADLRCSAIR